ncbi:MAG: Bax inhibitor-1 family protein [Candidatus Peribacteraceae bacterium]|nr:Bax inhibitor-1 family protein [Candidatus Peribacteraceae bacterium]
MSLPFTSSTGTAASALTGSRRFSVYALFAVAMALTLVGIGAGVTFAQPIIDSGWALLLILFQFALVLTARMWSRTSPLNYFMFGLFPLFSGLTITPFLISVLTGYANGGTILLNAAIATVLLSGSAAVLARMGIDSLGSIGGILFNAVIGLVILGILQLIFPSLRGGPFEVIVSGAGILTFSLFLAYDLRRLGQMHAAGESPVLLALSLYLDAFNLFLSVVRFMVAIGGRRR